MLSNFDIVAHRYSQCLENAANDVFLAPKLGRLVCKTLHTGSLFGLQRSYPVNPPVKLSMNAELWKQREGTSRLL